MHTIYLEKSLQQHPRVARILSKFSQAAVILCDHYGQVFNPKSQNFRLQKQVHKPALILANKTGRRVLPTPESFGIGGQKNYYFSHMLNCLYDCRYCFLQGMYASANYVLFVNYEDFMIDIDACFDNNMTDSTESSYFFSGYDGDSLAFDSVSGFLEVFLPFFAERPHATLELRTKSVAIQQLLAQEPLDNVVVAFSFTPDAISQQVEHGVPVVAKRIAAIQRLAEHGWPIGLRFDPLIYGVEFERLYHELIDNIFAVLPSSRLHSVSLGPLRFPDGMYQKLLKLYPEDKLLAHPLQSRGNVVSYTQDVEDRMKRVVKNKLRDYVDDALLFECQAVV